MTKTWVALAFVVGCGGGGENAGSPHRLDVCDGTISDERDYTGEPCELACATRHELTFSTCDAEYTFAGEDHFFGCIGGFEFNGIPGCCLDPPGDQAGAVVVFAECTGPANP